MKSIFSFFAFILCFIFVNCGSKKSEKTLWETYSDYTLLNTIVSSQFQSQVVVSSTLGSKTETGRVQFGNIYYKEMGQGRKQTATIQNTGNMDLVVSAVNLYLDSNHDTKSTVFAFAPGSDSGFSLAPGGTREITIQFFSESQDMFYGQVLHFSGNMPTGEYSLAVAAEVTDFRQAKCGESETAVKLVNKESTTQTFHFFPSLALCEANNTETVPNSQATVSYASVPVGGSSAYQCFAEGTYYFGDGTGSSACSVFNSGILNFYQQYTVTYDPFLPGYTVEASDGE
ncbi:MAG: hypothetical protein AAF518_23370 [Spirochaetota bacterium]